MEYFTLIYLFGGKCHIFLGTGCYDIRKSWPNQLKPKVKERKMSTNRLFNLFSHQFQRSMSHMRLARLLLVCAVAFSAVASSQTALAATQPQIFTFLDEGSNLIDCGSFMVREDYSIPTWVIVFASYPDGEPIYGQAHQDYNGTFTNLNTGYSLPENGYKTIIFNNEAGTRRLLGLFVHVSIPGGGVAILDAGNLTFGPDGVTFAGNHHWADGPDLLCAALS
jgi:hypothetical protein